MAHSSLRFGIGRFTTEAEIDYVVEKIVAVVQRLRDMRYVINQTMLKSVTKYAFCAVPSGRWSRKVLISIRLTGRNIKRNLLRSPRFLFPSFYIIS